MIITLLVDNENSWINKYVKRFQYELIELGNQVNYVNRSDQIEKSDIAILLGCESKIDNKTLARSRHNLIVHESALPEGKGWSPVSWGVLEGRDRIVVSLFEATEQIDAGDIYYQDEMILSGNELIEEIRYEQWRVTRNLLLRFINRYPYNQAIKQQGEESFYPKRTKQDSELDIKLPINDQFNLLRIVDNERYPAFFVKNGIKYLLKIYKENESEEK